MQAQTEAFLRLAGDPVRFPLFMLAKLPSAFLSGVRITDISESACTVKVPYRWFTQNPFRSTYFACLAMAAELSTGALFMAHTYKSQPSVSILVTGMEATFFKKAAGTSFFVCTEGSKIREAIALTGQSGQAGTFRATSTGRNRDGDIIAEFHFVWSFKSRLRA